MKTLALLALGCVGFSTASATQVTQSDSPIVIITQEGVVPVHFLGGRPPKNSTSSTTYYLSSAVAPQIKKSSTPPQVAKPLKPIKKALVSENIQPLKQKPAKLAAQPTPSPTPPVIPKKEVLAKSIAPKPAPEKPNKSPSPSVSLLAVKRVDPKKAPQIDHPLSEPPKITVKKTAPPASTKTVSNPIANTHSDDEEDEYSTTALITDPLEPMNRGTFWMNHQLYRYLLKPVSKAYDTALPQPVRTGVYNVFDNLEFPVRFINDILQFKFKRAWQETGKFVVNSTVGVGGIMRVSDRIPALAYVPTAETGQTFAKWGIGHGAYLVLPVFGPKSLRDTVGLAGDIALSPVTWVSFGAVGGIAGATTLSFSAPDSVRTFHEKMGAYDAATENTLDRYLAVRTAYSQNRKQAAQR